MDLVATSIFVFAPLSAVVLHECVLRRVEVDHLALPIIGSALTTYWILVYYTDFIAATLVTSLFWIPLWLYIGAYRAFFHPLKDYPGPFGARLSRWWTIKQTWDSDLHYHRVLQRLQSKYGDYVRTGQSPLVRPSSCNANQMQDHASSPYSMPTRSILSSEPSPKLPKGHSSMLWRDLCI